MANEVSTQVSRPQELAKYFSSDENKERLKAFITGGPEQVNKFVEVFTSALRRDPSIAEASRKSLLEECMKAAQDGLVLDGREAVLTKFASRKKDESGNWVDGAVNVAYIPMIRGLRKLVYQSPQVMSWTTGLVREKEYAEKTFRWTQEPPALFHEGRLDAELGPIVAAYSVVRLKNGEVLIDVMSRAKLNAIKNRTKSKKRDGTITGPWATDEDEMFLKTVARHHFKSIPLGDKINEAFTRVDDLYDMGGDVLDVEPEEPRPQPRSVANKKNGGAAAKLAQAAAERPKPGPDKVNDPKADAREVIDHDPETGEVVDPDEQMPEGQFAPDDEY